MSRSRQSEARVCPLCRVPIAQRDLVLRLVIENPMEYPKKGLTVVFGRLITCPRCDRTLGVVRYLEDEAVIDAQVVAEADDDDAWEEPIQVPPKPRPG